VHRAKLIGTKIIDDVLCSTLLGVRFIRMVVINGYHQKVCYEPLLFCRLEVWKST